jgi:hypothetical protein
MAGISLVIDLWSKMAGDPTRSPTVSLTSPGDHLGNEKGGKRWGGGGREGTHHPTTSDARTVMMGPVAEKKTEKKARRTMGSRQYPRMEAVC